MKPGQIEIIKANISIQGYDNEIPLSVLKRELSNFVGIDKYRLKYTVDTLVELGFFEWVNIHSLKAKNNGNNGGNK